MTKKILTSQIFSVPFEKITQESIADSLRIQKEKEEADKKKEERRINNLKCPACKSKSKDHYVKSDSNGIFGPGYRSWKIEEYYVCKKCGCMFKDINKKQ